jgi:hypothetical protein
MLITARLLLLVSIIAVGCSKPASNRTQAVTAPQQATIVEVKPKPDEVAPWVKGLTREEEATARNDNTIACQQYDQLMKDCLALNESDPVRGPALRTLVSINGEYFGMLMKEGGLGKAGPWYRQQLEGKTLQQLAESPRSKISIYKSTTGRDLQSPTQPQ